MDEAGVSGIISRTGRGFIDVEKVVVKLQVGREGAIDVRRKARIGGPENDASAALTETTDRLAEALTGDATALHTKPHSAN